MLSRLITSQAFFCVADELASANLWPMTLFAIFWCSSVKPETIFSLKTLFPSSAFSRPRSSSRKLLVKTLTHQIQFLAHHLFQAVMPGFSPQSGRRWTRTCVATLAIPCAALRYPVCLSLNVRSAGGTYPCLNQLDGMTKVKRHQDASSINMVATLKA